MCVDKAYVKFVVFRSPKSLQIRFFILDLIFINSSSIIGFLHNSVCKDQVNSSFCLYAKLQCRSMHSTFRTRVKYVSLWADREGRKGTGSHLTFLVQVEHLNNFWEWVANLWLYYLSHKWREICKTCFS